MILEGHIFCEGPGCDRNARIDPPTMNAGRLPVGWIKAKEYGESEDYTSAFCGHDCLMKWAAKVPAPEGIPFFDGEREAGE